MCVMRCIHLWLLTSFVVKGIHWRNVSLVIISINTRNVADNCTIWFSPCWNMKNHTSAHRWLIRNKLYIPSQQHEESLTRHVDHVPCCSVPCICSFNLDVSGVVQRSVGSNTSCECSHERKSFNETVKSTSQKNTICLTFKFNIIGIVCTNFPCVNNSSNIDEVTSFRHRSSWNLDRQRVTKRKVKQWSS